MDLVLIPPGMFLMGSPDDGPIHPVRLSAPFLIGRYPVTQAQWQAVMGSNPAMFQGVSERPIETVSWQACVAFCQQATASTGRRVRLPSEAEWEYACRAGSTTEYSFGDDAAALADHGWHRANADQISHPVGQKQPNAWGLYDMHGGIDEYCLDTWHAEYTGAPADGSAWVATGDPDLRLLRGGSWYDVAEHCGSAHRNYYRHDVATEDHGLRVVVALAPGA
jgi:formylglycine-generating enzyme required for sulfatase activity